MKYFALITVMAIIYFNIAARIRSSASAAR